MRIVFIVFIVLAVSAIVTGTQSQLNNSTKSVEINSTESEPLPKVSPKTRGIDVIVLIERWYDTACYLWKIGNNTHKCSYPKDKKWSIHKLQPEIKGTKGPSNCNSSSVFDLEQISPIRGDLEAKFVGVEGRETNSELWKNNWDSYGTCGSDVPGINSQFKYFNKSIELFDKYNANDVFKNNNITIGNKYKVKDFHDAIERSFGKRGRVMCTPNKRKGEHYLHSINICFDIKFNLIDCDGVRGKLTYCPSKKLITYLSLQNDDVN